MHDLQPQPLKSLYVEDNDDLREIMALLFAQDGIQLTVCASAEEAIALLEKTSFDLVVTDINLPGKSGFELVEHILARQPSMCIIFASALDVDFARLKKNVRALSKPFTAYDLQRVARDMGSEMIPAKVLK